MNKGVQLAETLLLPEMQLDHHVVRMEHTFVERPVIEKSELVAFFPWDLAFLSFWVADGVESAHLSAVELVDVV